MTTIQSISKFSQDKIWKLKLLTFSSGAIVMALEIVTSRILTPVFGSTIYTWGSLIGIILSGLSLGYFLGGRLADNNPRFDKICGIVFTVGLFIVGIPFFASEVVDFTITVLPGTQFTPLLATFLLLMLPSVLLGFVSPYVIKLGTKSLDVVGNVSGNLYAIATIGSIFGTFTTVFVLIPNIAVNQIIFGLGIALIASSLIGLKIAPKAFAIAIVIVIALILIVPWSSVSVNIIPHNGVLIYQKETMFSHLDVIEYGQDRSLYLDGMRHSSMNLHDPMDLVIDYTEFFHLGFLLNSQIKDVLFVGGGGFTGPKNFLALYPETKVDVIELDADVIDVAKTYFALEEDPRLQIFNDDARKHLLTFDKKYDLIVLDAYASNYVPYHLLTDEFFEIVEQRLNSDGIIISNLIGSIEGENSPLVRSAYKTIKDTFPVSHVFLTEDPPTNVQNVIIVSSNNPYEIDRQVLLNLAHNSPADYLVDELSLPNTVYQESVKISDVPFLTDQFNPSEVLINPLTHKPYTEKFQEDVSQNKQQQEDAANMILGITLLIIAVIWMVYLKKIWSLSYLVK